MWETAKRFPRRPRRRLSLPRAAPILAETRDGAKDVCRTYVNESREQVTAFAAAEVLVIPSVATRLRISSFAPTARPVA